MKAKVLIEFHDKDDFTIIYSIGEIIDINKERYQVLKALGLAEEVRERSKQSEKGK